MRRALVVLAVLIVLAAVFVAGDAYGHYDADSGRSGVGVASVESEAQLDSTLRRICDQGKKYARISIVFRAQSSQETHTYEC